MADKSGFSYAVEIGAELRRLRKQAGIAQADLSRLTGIGIATISHAERGSKDTRIETLGRLLKALGARLSVQPVKTDSTPYPLEGEGYDLDLPGEEDTPQ